MESKRLWHDLSPDEQLQLREAFGLYLDSLPPTCSMESKIARFQQWLAKREILFDQSDLHR